MRDISFSPARVAVLVDGDNIPVRHAEAILDHAHHEGRPDIRRVYGDLAQRKGWEAAPGFRALHAGTGKNAADLMIAIDAMELALAGGVGHFVLVSSDRDFTHLAHRLRELGHGVTGLGEEKAPESFRAACTAFIVLQDVVPAPRPQKAQPAPRDRLLPHAIALLKKNGGRLTIADLNSQMLKAHNIRITAHGFPTWRAWLKEFPEQFTCDPKGQGAKVQLKT